MPGRPPGGDGQGGDILAPAQRRAVEALGRAWGRTYDVGGTRDGMYFARRDDGTGEALEASTPGELDAAIRADLAREVMR